MPRVEELEPRNVPQRSLKREVKREGVQGETRAQASDVSCAAQSRFAGEEEGTVFHPCQSYPQSQSTPDTSTSTHPSSGTLAVISPGSPDLSSPVPLLPACFPCHILCLASAVIYGRTQEAACVCVIARLQSRVRGSVFIRHPEAVTKVSINFFPPHMIATP